MNVDLKTQLNLIKRGIAEIISEEELVKKLRLNRPLIIKAGFDPTAPDLHLGHTVLLRKLRQLQDFGHIVYFLIGDFTAMIGDPTGVSVTRPALSNDEIEKNSRTYKKQVFKILDEKKTKVVFNSYWFSKMDSKQLLGLAKYSSVAQLLARADFSQRYQEGKNISLLEFFYPLLQAYDSVHLKADIELGGSDQKFNLLFGRQLQQDFSQEQQVVIMTPILEGLDGVNKMSKSLGNYVGIEDIPADMFGKIMSISDTLMMRYYELLTNENLEDVQKAHPMEAKKKLAGLIVADYWGIDKAKDAKAEFEKVFQRGDNPDDVLALKLPPAIYSLNQIFDRARDDFKKLEIDSRNKLLSLLEQGAVTVDGKKMVDANAPDFCAHKQYFLKIGKRRFLKIDTSG